MSTWPTKKLGETSVSLNSKIKMQKSRLQLKNKKWDYIPILKYCDFERGTEPGSASYNREGDGVPFIRVGNIAAQIQEQIYTVSKNIKLCKKDDLLLVLDGSPGVVVRGIEGAFSSGIRRIIIKNPGKILKAFILYVLQANFVQNTIKEYSTGVTIKHASKSLEYIQIPLPSFPEQQKIVEVLDTIQEGVNVQDKIIEKIKEMKKSLLNEIFNSKFKNQKSKLQIKIQKWEKLEEVAKIERGKFAHRPRNAPEYYGGDIPFIQTNDVTLSNGHIKKYNQTLNKKGLSVSRIFPRGTIVITIAANIGYSAIIDFDSAFPDSLVGITPNKNELDSEYLNYYLMSQQKKMDEEAPRGTQKNINIQFLNKWLVPIFLLPEQREIAEILQTVDRKIEIEQKKKALYEELFKTMLNKLMNREIKITKI